MSFFSRFLSLISSSFPKLFLTSHDQLANPLHDKAGDKQRSVTTKKEVARFRRDDDDRPEKSDGDLAVSSIHASVPSRRASRSH